MSERIRDIFSEEEWEILQKFCGSDTELAADLPLVMETDEERINELNEITANKASS